MNLALADSFVKTEFSPEVDLEARRKEALLEEMGLTTHDVDKLRATMLSADEAVHAKREELERIRRHKGQKTDWEEFVDVKRRMGHVRHHSDIIRRLRRVVPSLVVAPGGQKNRIGLYVVKNVPTDEIENCLPWRTRYIDCPIYVGWLELGWSPEYEIDIVNDVGVAVGQRRGWRTLLLRLIARRDQAGRARSVVSEERADAVFGFPSNGPTASNYRRQLWWFRNRFVKTEGVVAVC